MSKNLSQNRKAAKERQILGVLAAPNPQSPTPTMTTIKDHVIHLGNDGLLKTDGLDDWRTTPEDLREMLHVTMPAVIRNWPRKRVAFYAHGGMNDE
jgi:hypothetical protein